jgi:hypothetical protein
VGHPSTTTTIITEIIIIAAGEVAVVALVENRIRLRKMARGKSVLLQHLPSMLLWTHKDQTGNVGGAGGEDTTTCWICAEPVKYYAISECNYRMCHVCPSTSTHCTRRPIAPFARCIHKLFPSSHLFIFSLPIQAPQPSIIFTPSPKALPASFSPAEIPYKDAKLTIYFETQEMMEETLLLLHFNCPDTECNYIRNSCSDLKLHVRASHGRLMW